MLHGATLSMKHELFGSIFASSHLPNVVRRGNRNVTNHDTRWFLVLCLQVVQLRGKGTKNVDKIKRRLRSSHFVKDVIIHVDLSTLHLGGMAPQGIWSLPCFYSFRVFTHERTIWAKVAERANTLIEISTIQRQKPRLVCRDGSIQRKSLAWSSGRCHP